MTSLLAAVGAIILLVAVAWRAQRQTYLLQYLYFCRYPLLLASFLALILPAALLGFAGDMIGNLAILPPRDIVWVAFLASLASWTVLLLLAGLSRAIPVINGLPAARRKADPLRRAPWLAPLAWLYRLTRACEVGRMRLRPLGIYLTLAAPIVVTVIWRSIAEETSATRTALSIAAAPVGVALAFGGLGLSSWCERRWHIADREFAKQRFVRSLRRVRSESSGTGPPGVDPSRDELWDFARAFAWFVGIFLLLFVIGFFVSAPWLPASSALALVLGFACLVTLVLTVASVVLDVYRVRVTLALAAAILLLYWAVGADHYYDVVPAGSAVPPPTPLEAYETWRRTRDPARIPTPIIVTASGGGVTAAYWTATVLTGLQRRIPTFADSIVLVSGVSGGGVGAMYFVDRYPAWSAGASDPADASKALDEVPTRAGASSLSATVWGLIYLDAWRFALHPFVDRDRGWALEETWRRRMSAPDRDATLRGWASDVRAGRRPVQVFNATIAETGERFLFAPLTLPSRPDWPVRNFVDLYDGADVAVVTAARMAATFPFVSPIARPSRVEAARIPEAAAFHLADGGYYDNHGVATAIDFLGSILPTVAGAARDEDGGLPRVLVVRIRVGAHAAQSAIPERGLVQTILGPVNTLLRVRSSSQVDRNEIELRLLSEIWRGRVEIVPVELTLPWSDAPLSWHLSESDRRSIRRGWGDCEPGVERIRAALEPRAAVP